MVKIVKHFRDWLPLYSAAALIVGGAVTIYVRFTGVEARADAFESRLEEVAGSPTLTPRVASLESLIPKVQSLETQQAVQATQFKNISDGIGEVKEDVREIKTDIKTLLKK